MEALRDYLLSIVAVSLVGVLAVTLLRQDTMRRLARFVAGLLLLLTVARPLLGLGDLELEADSFTGAGEFSAEEAQARYREALERQVRGSAEQYIRDKAEALGATVQVEVRLSDGDPPAPWEVRIVGTLSAEQTAALADYITEAFGIPAARQEWKLYE